MMISEAVNMKGNASACGAAAAFICHCCSCRAGRGISIFNTLDRPLLFSSFHFRRSFRYVFPIHFCTLNFKPTSCKFKLLQSSIKELNSLDEALSLFKQMVAIRPPPSVIQFNKLLVRIANMKQYPHVFPLFRDICVLGIPVDDYIMNTVINCLCHLNRIDFGFSLLGTFFKRGIVPNAITFNTILKGLFLEGRIPEAQDLFKKIIYQKLCQPDVVTYGTVIDGLCKAGNTCTAMQFLRAMETGRCKPDTRVYSSIIDGLCKDKRVDEALALLYEMIQKGIAPDIVTYNCLIHGLCNLGKYEKVKRLFSEMEEFNISPDIHTFTALVDAFCKEGKIEDAEQVIQIMIQQGYYPNTVTYNALIGGYSLHGRMEEAKAIFHTMLARSPSPDIFSYNILINAFFKKLKVDMGMHLFREIPLKGLTPDVATFNTVIQGLFRLRMCATAIEVFKEMLDSSLHPNFYTYHIMLKGLSENGHIEEAQKLLQAVENTGAELH